MTDHHGRPAEHEAEEDAAQGPVLHGGEGDPLGGGVASLEDSDEVSEGEPHQDPAQLDK